MTTLTRIEQTRLAYIEAAIVAADLYARHGFAELAEAKMLTVALDVAAVQG